jgi:hypothetical protein
MTKSVDEFIAAQKRLERKWEEAIQRQKGWDNTAHITGRGLIKFFGAVVLGCAFVAFLLFEPEIIGWIMGLP